MRKSFACFALACAMAITPVAGSLQFPVNVLAQEARLMKFTDVTKDRTGYNQIKRCYENHWLDGVTTTRFDPDGELTRGAFMKILGRYAGINEKDYDGITKFTDVEPEKFYAPFIDWAVEKKITSGKTETKFAPKEGLTRDQMAVFLYKYFKMIAAEEGLELPVLAGRENMKFSDESKIMKGGADAVYALSKAGVINGKNGAFMPKNICTREQAAIFICNFDDMLQKARAAKEETTDTTLVDLGNGKIGRRVTTIKQLISMTHYNDYNDLNTGNSYYPGGKPVFDGYYTILSDDLLREIVNGTSAITVNMQKSGGDGYKYLLLDTGDIELAMAAAKKLNLVCNGKAISGLHLQYSKGYAGLNHGAKCMFAIVGDHYDAKVEHTTSTVIKGFDKITVTNPGTKDTVTFENAMNAEGKYVDTWESKSVSWEPKDRSSSDPFQKICLSYTATAKDNKDVYSEKYDQTFTMTSRYTSSISGKKTEFTNDAFAFNTRYEVKLELAKPSNYSYYMGEYFPFADNSNPLNPIKNTETSLPYWATVTATPERIDVYLSKGASLYYRWRYNDLFYTRCYYDKNAFMGPKNLDGASMPEDYVNCFMGTNGYPMIQELTKALNIDYHGTLPLRGVSYVYVHFDCAEKYVADKNSYYRATYGLPVYTRVGEKNPVQGGWESAQCGGRNDGFWWNAFQDYCVGHIENYCTVHKDCNGYPFGGDGDGFGGTTEWSVNGNYYEYKFTTHV